MLRVSLKLFTAAGASTGAAAVTTTTAQVAVQPEAVPREVQLPTTAELAEITTPVAAESIQAVHSWRTEFKEWAKEEAEFDVAEAKRVRGFDRHNIKALDEELHEEGDRYLSEQKRGYEHVDKTEETNSANPASSSGGEEGEASRKDGATQIGNDGVFVRPDDSVMDQIVEPTGLQPGDDGSASVRGIVKLQGAPGENFRWVQKAKDWRKVDDEGNYIVNHSAWHENRKGELAYQVPPEPSHIEGVRFGYNVIQVKKHVTYWQWYQHEQNYADFSIRYLNVYVLYIISISWVCAFLISESKRRFHLAQSGGNVGPDTLGKGAYTAPKIKYTEEEEEQRAVRAHEGFMKGDGHGEDYMGNKDYQMKKIPRPKEFSYETSLAELGVQQPSFTKSPKRIVRDGKDETGGGNAVSELEGNRTVRIKTPYDQYTEHGERKPRPLTE